MGRSSHDPTRAYLPLTLALALACGGPVEGAPGPGADAGNGGSGAGPDAGSGGSGPYAGSGGSAPVYPPGERVEPVALPAADVEQFSVLRQAVDSAASLDAAGLRAAHAVPFRSTLGYDPATSQHLDRIQASALGLDPAELAALGKAGFVVSRRREFGTFLRGLAEIYSEHLPLYVSADTILESIHSSYDNLLLELEALALAPRLGTLLSGMRERLTASTDPAAADADLYLAVALSLLEGTDAAPVAGASAARVTTLTELATAASGTDTVTLFGVEREEDFSQFKPRGHYESGLRMQRYFRAMIWLGRVDLRLVETLSNGDQVFRRPQFLATLLLHELAAPELPVWQSIDDTIRAFVGESDYMVLPEVASLLADLGGPEAARAASDQAVVAAIAAGGYGKQQIASHLMVNETDVATLPLNRSFALFGQRYVVDSHVFSETVYDRLPQQQRRMMPTPLDAAFAALGNDHALALHPDLDTFTALPGALGRMRVLVDAHDDAFFGKNLYNLWLQSLRALSPRAEIADPAAAGLPAVAATEAWGRRLLNTQLGSWAELRHDTLLYAKQWFTGIPACEYPDAYVDPYPDLWRAVAGYAASGERIAEIATAADATMGTRVRAYFSELGTVAGHLVGMSEQQRRGEAFTVEQLAFLNDAVRVDENEEGCVTVEIPNGWYARLFYGDELGSLKFDPTIADVHTQPADEGGAIVGKVLHVGTGYPRMMVTTVDTCGGPKAYVGVVFAYHEETTTNFVRLTDATWAQRFQGSGERPADVSWMLSNFGR
ncbi:MAG: DUF3160 domain-containing protein [Deltaproteobacteria bacterium]|nr:DUF3160 domain-containing protein [Deltaproteobacteria bacterium]